MLNDQAFQYPSTRYSGSKRRFLDWIWEHVNEVKFQSVLDVFGGTGSVSLLFKREGKEVHYNDLLNFNILIGKAIIENNDTIVTEDDLNKILNFKKVVSSNFIQREFKGLYYLDNENKWLDAAATSFAKIKNPYKKAIIYAALFQACLAKRPFNLFHRANLYIRTNNVKRTFGNKTTWEQPFESLLRKYVAEYNKAVFDNSKDNKVVGGYDALSCPNGVDLVYLDPPYFSSTANYGTNYLCFYHFLEGLANYDNWSDDLSSLYSKTKRLADYEGINSWTRKNNIYKTFKDLIERYQNNIIVLSYQSNGFPSKYQILSLLKKCKKRVKVFSKTHRYVLSRREKKELLFIAE